MQLISLTSPVLQMRKLRSREIENLNKVWWLRTWLLE